MKRSRTVTEWVLTVLLLLFGFTAVCQPFVIPTGSMEDTLKVGDHMIVDKLAFAHSGPIGRMLLPYQDPKHGDIIAFQYAPDLHQTLVKRVIGVPGDRIRITQGVLYRNGKPVYEPYVFHKYAYDPKQDNHPWPCCRPVRLENEHQRQRDMLETATNGEIVVPPGSYFAMGDNRDNSFDSRFWGFVPRDNIVGKPVLIYWSYRATTDELVGADASSVIAHVIDLGKHFFTHTRWDRTLKLIRGVPDEALPSHPVSVNTGDAEP